MELHRVVFHGLILAGSILLICHIVTPHKHSSYNTHRYSEHCMKKKPIRGNYTAQGNEYNIGDLPVYESPNRKPKRLLIAIYDIFGLSDNMKQVVDKIANLYDFRVVMPDFFRGKPWDENIFPPKNEDELDNWMETNASWTKIVKPDIQKVIKDFRARDKIIQVGIFGMCWGGKVATLAATEIPEIKAAGAVHPSGVENDEAKGVKAPMYVLPSQDEDDMLPFYQTIRKKFGYSGSGHKRFDDMEHGFAGARGNFSDPLNAKRVKEVIDTLGYFFDKNLQCKKA